MEPNKKLFLLDAYALIFRSYYAFIKNPMFNGEGLNTSCIFGFVNTLEELLLKEKPSHIAVAFDPGGPNFRHELYPEYKANRDETPEDIKKSVPIIKDILKAYGIPILQVSGFEADDVIGSLAKKAERDGYTVYMMTPDKDYIQLLSDNIYIYKPSRSGSGIEVIDKSGGCNLFKLNEPVQFVDILALMGDTSDNIPGAPGIGEKTAMKLIQEFNSIDNLYENLSKLKGKVLETLVNNKDQVYLSQRLARIAIDIPLDVNEQELILSTPDLDKLKELFDRLNFKSLEKRVFTRINGNQVTTVTQNLLFDLPPVAVPETSNFTTINEVPHEYKVADSDDLIDSLISQLNSLSEFCFDTETTGLNVMQVQLVGMSFSWEKSKGWYVPFSADQAQVNSILAKFKDLFADEQIIKVGQNIKYDILVLKNYGIEIKGAIFDTMVAHYLIQPELRHNMNFLAEQYLSYSPVHIEELIGQKGKQQLNMRSVSIEKIKEYAVEDADVTYQLKHVLFNNLNEDLLKLAESVEMPLIHVLAEMEFEGVKINDKALLDFSHILREDIIKIEKQIFDFAGCEFNISSPKQMGEILFDKLQIDTNVKLTKTKQYSTSEETLAALLDKHEIVPLILEYRGLLKLLNTYVEALPKMINSKTGRIHTSYNQTIAATGRLSSVEPNLQNIPIRDERGREIRKAFVARNSDFVLMSADYSQIELRVMAHFSEDEHMLEAFHKEADIHASTAAKIYNIPEEEVTSDMRRKAKTANFGIIYGISAFGLAQRLQISRKEASELIEGYFKTFPGVKKYMDDCIKIAREKGYVETLLGRRRLLPDIHSNNSNVRGMAERNAINSPIQGSAADIIKIAMIDIHRELKNRNMRSKMILQVHDELVFDIFRDELDEIKILVKDKMENALKLKVPLLVEMGVGENWVEAH
jgi:DNA polymerase I